MQTIQEGAPGTGVFKWSIYSHDNNVIIIIINNIINQVYYFILAAVLGSPTKRISSAMTFTFTKSKEDRNAAYLYELHISRVMQDANQKTFKCNPSTCTASGLSANTEYIAWIVACAPNPPLCSQASGEKLAFTNPDSK